MRRSLIGVLAALLALAAPAVASAHARSATVALDYRLRLDAATGAIPGVSVDILDGDRSLRIGVARGTLVVRGDLGEPMLRIDADGAWANRASVTAVAERLVTRGSGWQRVASGSSYAWHEHRLAPPPYGSRTGVVAHFTIPATLDGRPVAIGGSFVRYRRPSPWPWLGAAAALAAALAYVLRARVDLRPLVATVLGAVAGLAALATLVVFSAADAPNGRVAWVQIALGAALAAALYGALIRTHGASRVRLAGLIGAVATAVTLGSTGVFQHGVVVSLLSADASRALCAAAIVAGVAAAAAGLTAREVR